MKLALVKQMNNSFISAYGSDYEYIKSLEVGKVYFFEVKRERNIAFHRKFFALIKMVFQNQEHYKSFDKLRKDLIKSAGFIDTHITIWGEEVEEAKSISFANMGEEEFKELYNRVLDEIVKHFHFEKQVILDNIEQFY